MGAGRGITASAILGTTPVTLPRHREDLRPERQVPGPEQGLGKWEGLFRLPNVLQAPDTHPLCPMDRWPSWTISFNSYKEHEKVISYPHFPDVEWSLRKAKWPIPSSRSQGQGPGFLHTFGVPPAVIGNKGPPGLRLHLSKSATSPIYVNVSHRNTCT